MFLEKKKIEDLILSLLTKGPRESTPLVEEVLLLRPNVSKQGVYKALREVKKNEIVVQAGKKIGLSSVWIKRLNAFAEEASLNYIAESAPGIDFLKLKEGERISYSFKTLDATDAFWGHAFAILAEITPPTIPVLIYNPHEWFLIARTESEVFLFEKLKTMGKKLYLLAGHKHALDIYVSKYFDGKSSRYRTEENLPFKPNYYINAFGGFVIEVFLDKKVSEEIDAFYESVSVLDASAKERLRKIISARGKHRLVISRNKRKSDTLKRFFEKRFLIEGPV